MKINKFLPFVLILMCLSCNDSETKDVFMFKNNGEDGLHLAYSMDGLKWKALNNDQSFLEPELSKDKLMRDPCIILGPDGKYHMVWTVSWNEKGIGYANSEDLITWSQQKFIPVMQHEKEARNSWAPELFYDDIENQYLIFWASTVSDSFTNTSDQTEDGYNHRMYYTTTKDFDNFSETKLFVEPGFNVIDATIAKNENEYFMIIKDETLLPEAKKSLHILFSGNLYDWNVPFSDAISWSWVEGPAVTKLGDDWLVYFDQYRKGKFGALKSNDLENWEDISNAISFPDGVRHGTVFKVSKKELSSLKKYSAN
jgi:hypothetical protein